MSKSKAVLLLPVIMITAAYIRLRINSSCNYLLIGGDGPYYPLQVRSMLEHFKLALPDMPLLFMIEAGLAKILILLNYASPYECVITACKVVDAILPPLAAIPVFLIAKEFITDSIKSKALNYLVVAFSVINITTTLFFSNGLQKNAVAVVGIFFYLYFVIRYLKYTQRKDLYYGLLVLMLCALTHFGSFALLLFFTFLTGLFWIIYNRQQIKFLSLKRLLIACSALVLLVSVIAWFDYGRFMRLVSIPFRVFESPVLLLLLDGFDIRNYLNPIQLITINLLSVIALIIVIANRKLLDKTTRIILYSLITASFFLISPLIGIEWANRLYVMSYIPVVVVYLIIFSRVPSKWVKAFPALIFAGVVSLCLLNSMPNTGCITDASYTEFTQIKQQVAFSNRDVMIGRQDLRILGSWEFRIKSVVDYLLTKEDFKTYNHVYVIRQISGSNFSKGRFRGDAEVPENALKIYSGTCFELYALKNNEAWKGGSGKPSKARGRIIRIDKEKLFLKNDKTGLVRTIELRHPIIHFLNDHTELKNGSYIEVWGSWKPFSLNVIAESIDEIETVR